MELSGGLVGVDKREELNVGVAHVAGRVEVAEVVDRVDGAEDVVADEPVTWEYVVSGKSFV